MSISNGLTLEDAKKIISGRDHVILVDASISMSTPDCGGTSRWNFVKEVVSTVGNVCAEYDDDGIDLGFFGGETGAKMLRNVKPEQISASMPPSPTEMTTYTGIALDEEFKRYVNSGSEKPITFVVFTDGVAHDPDVVKSAIRNAAEWAGDGERIGISFLQIGNDQAASDDLDELDNNLGEKDLVKTFRMQELVDNLHQIEFVLAQAVVG